MEEGVLLLQPTGAEAEVVVEVTMQEDFRLATAATEEAEWSLSAI